MVRIPTWVRSLRSSRAANLLGGLITRAAKSYVVIVIVGVVIGLQVAPVVTSWTGGPVSGTIAVIPLEGSVDGGSEAEVTAMLQRAREDPQIKAVVLLVNSPGGSAPASEGLYLAVKRTAAEMPVVASVDAMSASGAYFAMAPSDEIFVKPGSFVGSVGVIFIAPPSIDPIDQVITSGPNKLTGADGHEWEYKVESVRRAFVGAVVESRGDRLELDAGEVSHAKLYTGAEAADNGLADQIGGLPDAVDRAAEMAGLIRYDVRLMQRDGAVYFLTRANYLASDAEDKRIVGPEYFLGTGEGGGVSVGTTLMLPPEIVLAERAGAMTGAEPTADTGGIGPAAANATVARGVADGA